MSHHKSLGKADFSRIIASGDFYRLSFGCLWCIRNYNDEWISQIRLGLIISKKIGNSVVRHRISRQIKNYFYQENLISDSAYIIRVNIPCNKRGLPNHKLHELDKIILNHGSFYDQ